MSEPEHDPTEGGQYIACRPCSLAGGAERAVYHAPPECPMSADEIAASRAAKQAEVDAAAPTEEVARPQFPPHAWWLSLQAMVQRMTGDLGQFSGEVAQSVTCDAIDQLLGRWQERLGQLEEALGHIERQIAPHISTDPNVVNPLALFVQTLHVEMTLMRVTTILWINPYGLNRRAFTEYQRNMEAMQGLKHPRPKKPTRPE